MAARAALFLALAAALSPVGIMAAESAPEAVRAAQAALTESAPRGRLAALGAAIAAQEAALTDARAALRSVAERQAATRAALGGRDGAAFAALAALHTLQDAPPLALRLHPAGPVAAARAARALMDAAPTLAARAAATRGALAEQAALATEGAGATARLRAALAALQALHADLAQRGGSGETSHEAPALERDAAVAVAALAQAAGRMNALRAAPRDAAAPGAPWPLPVAGGARADGAGLALSAPAWAVVRAPMTATLRYAGAAGGAGLTAVLEPQAGVLVVLRGLASVGRAVGETLLAGEPLGALGGPPPAADEFLIDASAAKGTIPQSTLYIGVMRGGEPDDPAAWFALTAERTGE